MDFQSLHALLLLSHCTWSQVEGVCPCSYWGLESFNLRSSRGHLQLCSQYLACDAGGSLVLSPWSSVRQSTSSTTPHPGPQSSSQSSLPPPTLVLSPAVYHLCHPPPWSSVQQSTTSVTHHPGPQSSS